MGPFVQMTVTVPSCLIGTLHEGCQLPADESRVAEPEASF